MTITRYAYKQGKALVRRNYGDAAVVPYKSLFSAASKAPPSRTPAAVLAKTPLKSYLDRTYAKKCGVEVKQVDVTAASAAVTTTLTSVITPYVGIGQGLTDSTRSGNSLEVKNCEFNLNFFAGAASASAVLVRVMLIRQLQMQQINITGAAVLQAPTDIKSPILLDKTRSFQIIKDQTFKLASLTGGDADSIKRWKFNYVPKGCHEVEWIQSDTTGAVTNMLQGNLALLVMYQGATAPIFDYYVRAKWLDI